MCEHDASTPSGNAIPTRGLVGSPLRPSSRLNRCNPGGLWIRPQYVLSTCAKTSIVCPSVRVRVRQPYLVSMAFYGVPAIRCVGRQHATSCGSHRWHGRSFRTLGRNCRRRGARGGAPRTRQNAGCSWERLVRGATAIRRSSTSIDPRRGSYCQIWATL